MEPEVEAAQRVGTTLKNKWTLERLIGTGGMAAVYVANHKIGRREAIKILHAEVAKDPELRARFEQEAHAVNRFKHPGAVEVRDIDVAEDGAPFLVMELLEGQSLADLARQPGGVPLGDLLRMADELLDVLAAAHAQGIIHRDVKPDNLFVLHDGRLKVLDFGIARVRAGVTNATPRTRIGATLGTAPYMPPEQIRGAEIDGRADLFAVGATLFRLIARRRVQEAATETEMLVKMASVQAPPLLSVAPDAPRDVGLVVDRALMFERDQRYPDALTMQGDVRALRAGMPPPYATALADRNALPAPGEGALVLLPTASDRITRDGPTKDAQARAPSDTETTAVVASAPASSRTAPTGAAGPSSSRTAAASPVALHFSTVPAPASHPQAPVTSPSPAEATPRSPDAAPAPLDDPGTQRAMMVLGAAGLGAPLASPRPAPAVAEVAAPAPGSARRPEPAPPSSSTGASVPTEPGPPRKLGERTLRSEMGPEASGGHVAPQGYTVAPVSAPLVLPPASRPGARTQVAGAMPMAPGESIPVLAAPRRARTLPGTEIRVVPLVLVGVVFAAIGVGTTLFFMLSDSSPATTTEPRSADTGSRGHSPFPPVAPTHSPPPVVLPHNPQGSTPAGLNRSPSGKTH
jgi:eukaryotic-like serine/threonine-protein kinase